MKLRRFLSVCLTLSVLLLQFNVGAEPLRLLCIGNSYSRDAVVRFLHPMFAADGDDITICNLYYPAATLQYALLGLTADSVYTEAQIIENGKLSIGKNVRIKDFLSQRQWDFVSIQQASAFSGIPGTYEIIPSLISEIYKHTGENQKIIFHQTWAYADWTNDKAFATYENSTDIMYSRIVDCTSHLMDDYPQLYSIVPAGTSIQNARRNTKTLKKLSTDGVHLDSLGCFTAACAWYETLTGRDSRKNSYKPDIISREAAALARQCAHNAVEKPFEVSRLQTAALTQRPAPFDIRTSVGIIVFRPLQDNRMRLTITTPAGLRIFDSETDEEVLLRIQSGIYLISVDGIYVRSVII